MEITLEIVSTDDFCLDDATDNHIFLVIRSVQVINCINIQTYWSLQTTLLLDNAGSVLINIHWKRGDRWFKLLRVRKSWCLVGMRQLFVGVREYFCRNFLYGGMWVCCVGWSQVNQIGFFVNPSCRGNLKMHRVHERMYQCEMLGYRLLTQG